MLLTLDATTGQNALNQVEIFRKVAGVNGLVMTKLDGTARGGILVAIAAKHKLPVYFIGVGETRSTTSNPSRPPISPRDRRSCRPGKLHESARREESQPVLKLALELGPLVVFFLANARGESAGGRLPGAAHAWWPIFVATAFFMVAMLISQAISHRAAAPCRDHAARDAASSCWSSAG